MKKLLYIRHSYHSKTKSNDFLVDLLRTNYDVFIFDIDPYTHDTESRLKELRIKEVDVLLLFQLPISGNLLKKYIEFKKGIFFPMYDGAPSRKDDIWLSWKDFNIINFSKTLHDELLNMGFSTFYIQYFPKPYEIKDWGDEKSIFFWQRLTKLNFNTLYNIFKYLDLKNVHIHKAIDPSNDFVEPANNNLNIEYSVWYENKNEMLKDIEKSAFYVAPRLYEGIGMSFLEAMSMGRCVISPNYPTMNEYIKDGETGILYDFNDPKIRKRYDIKKIQENTYKYINEGFTSWTNNKHRILDYINSPVECNEKKLSKIIFSNKQKLNFIQKIFSIINNNTKTHKIITILGIKIKIKRKT